MKKDIVYLHAKKQQSVFRCRQNCSCRGVATIFGVFHTPARVCQKPCLYFSAILKEQQHNISKCPTTAFGATDRFITPPLLGAVVLTFYVPTDSHHLFLACIRMQDVNQFAR